MVKWILLLVLIFLSTTSTVAQRHFYLDEPFKHPTRIPADVAPLLRNEIKKACRGETVYDSTNVNSWFSASNINVNAHRHALILKSHKSCLTGADNDWFWIVLKAASGYRLVLTGGSLFVDVLRETTYGLHDIETNVATARTNYRDRYKFNGSVYKAHRCWESTPVEAKPVRVPCRAQ